MPRSTVGPNSTQSGLGVSPWARKQSKAMPVMAVDWPGQEPSGSCWDLSHRSARMTVSSPPELPPYSEIALPRWPGEREPTMPRMTMGLLMMATLLISAGLGETGSLLAKLFSWGLKFSVGPSNSVSTGSNSNSSSGGGGGSSSISGVSVTSRISTGRVSARVSCVVSMVSSSATAMMGRTMARKGPVMRWSWSTANLYSPLSLGWLRPSRVRLTRSFSDSSSKSLIIST